MEKVTKNYARVRYSDGINSDEAKLIAQMLVMKSRYTQGFDVLRPHLYSYDETFPYRNFWFVEFPSEDRESFYRYLVVVDKKTGGIIKAVNYLPAGHNGFEWLFERKD